MLALCRLDTLVVVDEENTQLSENLRHCRRRPAAAALNFVERNQNLVSQRSAAVMRDVCGKFCSEFLLVGTGQAAQPNLWGNPEVKILGESNRLGKLFSCEFLEFSV